MQREAFVLIAAVVWLGTAHQFPAPFEDLKTNRSSEETAVLAGGCYWGVEAVFERLNGVKDVVSGFSGRGAPGPVGPMPHAEVVKITYDPAKISFGTLLNVFFSVAHDPTQLNRQGPDQGPEYRSSIFYVNDEQRRVAEAYIRQLSGAKVFSKPIVTTVVAFDKFYTAPPEHQDFVTRNPNEPYVQYNDVPKLARLEKEFPQLIKRR
jgi:peptide-methionine (S)-S-oxide reductase